MSASQPIGPEPANRNAWPWIAALLVTGCWVRLLLLGYEPVFFPDSGTYVRAAADLLSGDPSLGMGRRTPGYPLVILLAGSQPLAVMALQMLAGLGSALALFWITLRLTGSPVVGFWVGLLHHLSLQQLFQEALILTETYSAFTTIATLACFVALLPLLKDATRPPRWQLAALGLLATWALMVRPQFIIFVGLLPLAIAWQAWRDGRPATRAAALSAWVGAPAVILILAWCAYQQAKVGYFTLSTQSGFGLVNHPIDYFEQAPERFAVVRDILIQTRDQRIAEAGHARNTIWYAWPDIQRATGWTMPEASRQLTQMCREMFIADPARYARSVFSAWVDFWTVPLFWKPELYRWPAIVPMLEGVWWVEHKLLRLCNLAFVLSVAAALLAPRVRRRLSWDLSLSVIAATVLASSLLQAVADQGASSRYHLPTQSLVVMFVAVIGWRWFNSRSDRRDRLARATR